MKYLLLCYFLLACKEDNIYLYAEQIICHPQETCTEEYNIGSYSHYDIEAFYLDGNEQIELDIEDGNIFLIADTDDVLRIRVDNQSDETYIIVTRMYYD